MPNSPPARAADPRRARSVLVSHTELFHLIGLVDRLVGDLPPEGPAREDLADLRRVLYGLVAILRLNMAQEEELNLSLGDDAGEIALDDSGMAA